MAQPPEDLHRFVLRSNHVRVRTVLRKWDESIGYLERKARKADLAKRELFYETIELLKRKKSFLENELKAKRADQTVDQLDQDLEKATRRLTEAFLEAESWFNGN